MDTAEQERLYREAMAARRAGEVCPLCGRQHTALSPCPPGAPNTPVHVPPSARNSDPETSHEAAAPTPSKEALRYTCLALYAAAPEGLVDDDLARLAGHPEGHESYRRRGSDLRALKWTEWLIEYQPGDLGTPVRRRTHLGATARVSVITPKGRDVLARRAS
jgi:ribosomal protein L34